MITHSEREKEKDRHPVAHQLLARHVGVSCFDAPAIISLVLRPHDDDAPNTNADARADVAAAAAAAAAAVRCNSC